MTYEEQAVPARWYIVHAYSNFEQKVAEAIREQAQRQALEDQFEDIQVPTEEVTEVVRGSKKVRQNRHFPGYVLVKMDMTDEAYHLVKNTPKVTGFLGAQNKPQPVSEKEIERILGRVAEQGAAKPRQLINYDIGERVRVSGRETPVDLEYGQVEKMR
jgi:transcriptional antiterminator NusG